MKTLCGLISFSLLVLVIITIKADFQTDPKSQDDALSLPSTAVVPSYSITTAPTILEIIDEDDDDSRHKNTVVGEVATVIASQFDEVTSIIPSYQARFPIYQVGDIVKEFQLMEHLNWLGNAYISPASAYLSVPIIDRENILNSEQREYEDYPLSMFHQTILLKDGDEKAFETAVVSLRKGSSKDVSLQQCLLFDDAHYQGDNFLIAEDWNDVNPFEIIPVNFRLSPPLSSNEQEISNQLVFSSSEDSIWGEELALFASSQPLSDISDQQLIFARDAEENDDGNAPKLLELPDAASVNRENIASSYKFVPSISRKPTQQQQDPSSSNGCLQNQSYCLEEHIFHGGHGEIWRATRKSRQNSETSANSDNDSQDSESEIFVLKRMMNIHQRSDIYRCALREIFFGRWLASVASTERDDDTMEESSAFTEFISWFTTPSAPSSSSSASEVVNTAPLLASSNRDGINDSLVVMAGVQDREFDSNQKEKFSPPHSDPNEEGKSFEGGEEDIWLVFRDEGPSLQSLLYAIANKGTGGSNSASSAASSSLVLKPSLTWKRMRTTKIGQATFKGILFQLIANTAELHDMGIIHRDIKPSNLLIRSIPAKQQDDDSAQRNTPPQLKLITSDFSSAVTKSVVEKMLERQQRGDSGASRERESENGSIEEILYPVDAEPSTMEETLEYAPPEVLLSIPSIEAAQENSGQEENNNLLRRGKVALDLLNPESYDSWSVGVVFLEMILGTNNLFGEDAINPRRVAMIRHKLKHHRSTVVNVSDPTIVKNVLLLASLADFGILPIAPVRVLDTASDQTHETSRNKKSSGKKEGATVVSDEFLESLLAIVSLGHHAMPRTTGREARKKIVEDLQVAIKRRDPLGEGFTDPLGLDLLCRLLNFVPEHRISMREALGHAYFHGIFRSTMDGSEFSTQAERDKYDHDQQPDLKDNFSAEYSVLEQEQHENVFVEPSEMEIDANSAAKTIENDSDTIGLPLKTPKQLIEERLEAISFECPHCLRQFSSGEGQACAQHLGVNRGKHGEICRYLAQPSSSSLTGKLEVTAEVNSIERKKRAKKGSANKNLNGEILEPVYHHNSQILASTLPDCLSLGASPTSQTTGACIQQGRRSANEDFVITVDKSVENTLGFEFFGVFDGHCGRVAAQVASTNLLEYFLKNLQIVKFIESRRVENGDYENSYSLHREQEWLDIQRRLVFRANPELFSADKEFPFLFTQLSEVVNFSSGISRSFQVGEIVKALQEAYQQVDQDLTEMYNIEDNRSTAVTVSGEVEIVTGEKESARSRIGGSTATTVLIFPELIAVANAGDSRAVLCCSFASTQRAIAISFDHSAADATEQEGVRNRGGFVDSSKSKSSSMLSRVNGKLAVTRSLGDSDFGDVISPEPDILVIHRTRQENNDALTAAIPFSAQQNSQYNSDPCRSYHEVTHSTDQMFIIIASDGLWEVMTNEEAVKIVCGYLLEEYFISAKATESMVMYTNADVIQRTSKFLAQEALMRGSSDNVAVVVKDLRP